MAAVALSEPSIVTGRPVCSASKSATEDIENNGFPETDKVVDI